MRLRVHPLFFALALALIAFGQAYAFVWTFLALALHELGHAAAARARGYVIKELVLLPYGAMMSSAERFDKASSVIIGLAGPLTNAFLALAVLGIWWLVPAAYPYTEIFFYSNVSLALFNMLPVYPLDGSRVVLGLSKNKIKAIKGMQIAGVALSFVFLGLFIASAFYKINFTIGIIAVFLFAGATGGSDREMYSSVLDASSKNYDLGVEKKQIAVSADTPVARLYHHISSVSDTLFVVVDGQGKKLFEIDETKLKNFAVKNRLSTPIGAYFIDYKSVKEESKEEYKSQKPLNERAAGAVNSFKNGASEFIFNIKNKIKDPKLIKRKNKRA